jgi:arabinosaccharide transport system substrate-binding protein
MKKFPYGNAAFAILVMALLSGSWLAAHTAAARKSTLTLWVFSKEHHENYLNVLPTFLKKHPGVTVDVQLVANNTLAARLQAAMVADADVPDMCEIEITQAGTFFRGPLKSVGFTDLTDRIHRTGLWDQLVQARFAPYTKQGHIFGLPHDVHPVAIAYNREAYEKLGIDPAKIETWDDFIAAGRRITRTTGANPRYLIEMSDFNRDHIEPLLFQRGGGFFDANGKCILDNDKAVETMAWYVPLVAGPHKIGNSLGGNGLGLTQSVESEYILSLIAPDWRTRGFENDIAHMSGKMALMPLPAVTKGGPRTSTWGGTMMGITKHCTNPDLAWELAMQLYYSREKLADRYLKSNILPPKRDLWDDPAIQAPKAYWSGQRLGKIYAELAPQVPPQYASPFLELAKNKLSDAVIACVQRYNATGDAGFEDYCRARLKQSAEEVRRQMARNPY